MSLTKNANFMKKMPVPVFIYSEGFNLELGPHVFPAIKFSYVYSALKEDNRFAKHTFIEPDCATHDEILTVHSKDYLKDLLGLKNSSRLHKSELPLTKDIVDAFLLSTGGTIRAAHEALEHGRAMNIGGGFHHAFRNQAEGFCYINDVAVAVRTLQKQNKIEKALIIDLDVHQGNGTAHIFRLDRRRVFTFSMHEEKNYPIKKEKSSLDIALETACDDETYLELLEKSLEKIQKSFQPDIIFYLGGVDTYRLDRLGGLSITKQGMAKRELMISRFMPDVPLVAVLAGGYAVNDTDTVELHLQTCEALGGFMEKK